MNKKIDRLKYHARRVAEHRHVRRAVFTFHTLMIIVAVLAAGSMVAQLLYPADRALPFARIDNIDVGGLTRIEIEKKLEAAVSNASVTIKTPEKTYNTKWSSVGLTIDSSATARSVIAYTFWERLIPFSSIPRSALTFDTSSIIIVEKERLRAFANKIVAENKQNAVEAEVVIQEGKVVLLNGKGGFAFTAEDVERQLQTASFQSESHITLRPRIVTAAANQEALVETKLRAEKLVSRTITLIVDGKVFKPTSAEQGSWLQVIQDPVTHLMAVQLKKESLQQYLETLSKQVAKPASETRVTLLDGQEIARLNGVPGKTIDVVQASQAIEKAMFDQKVLTTINLALIDQPPQVSYIRTYSRTDTGLLALIRDWEAETYGTYGIVVREVGGQNRYAEFQPDRSFVTASTFKMFLAYVVLTKMERAEIRNETILDNGWTASACLSEMILHSTNPCAVAFQNLIGQQQIEAMVHEAGFLDTHLNNENGGDKYSTIRDETNFMLRLQAGTLLNDESTERLTGLLKRQVWRGGIPAGVPLGTVVANKVGFYNGNVHDVGIIYSPKATYILGVMSRGGSDPVFADLSRRVYNFFNR